MNCCVKSKELTPIYSWRIKAVGVVICFEFEFKNEWETPEIQKFT